MKKICVYCGSRPGNNPAFLQAAHSLGKLLADHGLGLVYGGASIGLMAETADAVLAGGAEVYGVIPQALADVEVAHDGLTELHIVKNMHERKALMAELSDGFIALPGGLGTFEELFEILTWAQLGFHEKPCGLLNIANYYDGLLDFLDQSVAAGFVNQAHLDLLLKSDSPETLIKQMLGKPAFAQT